MFDFNSDGEIDCFELFAGLQMLSRSRREAIELTGDDTFYLGGDSFGDEEDEGGDAFFVYSIHVNGDGSF